MQKTISIMYQFMKYYNFQIKLIIIFITIISFFFLIYLFYDKSINPIFNIKAKHKNKLIYENFFVFDSNNLGTINSHLYGFIISKEGIITDNYYKNVGFYADPEPCGAYVMIRKIGNEVTLNQDSIGCFGLYFFENKKENYFALSNSFLLLEEFLVGKQIISLNKDFADNFIVTPLWSNSIKETLINEIIELPSNTVININITQKKIKFLFIDYKENTIPLNSLQGLKIIDNWVDKWTYIFRSLKNKTNNLAFQLSGGLDTRTVLAILINSAIDLNNIIIQTFDYNKTSTYYKEDFIIASNLSSKFKFKLNNFSFDNESTIWSKNDSLFSTIYSNLGFQKLFNLRDRFYNKPRFIFTGFGGENLRGYPGYPIDEFLEHISSQGKDIPGKKKIFYYSSMRFCKRNIDLLKNKNKNNYEISSDLFYKGGTKNHFGRLIVEGFIANIYSISPLMDPEIKKIKFNIHGKDSHDLIAYIYTRYAPDLINFPIQGMRKINHESIKKAQKLNKYSKKYKIKFDLNKNFFIDSKKISPVFHSQENKTAYNYLKELYKTTTFIQNIKKVYDNNVFLWVKNYCKKKPYSLIHYNGLLAIAVSIHYISLNQKYMKKAKNNKFMNINKSY